MPATEARGGTSSGDTRRAPEGTASGGTRQARGADRRDGAPAGADSGLAGRARRSAGAGGTSPDRRAQSETIGFVLLVAIAVMGMATVVALGATAVEDSRHAMEVGSAQHAMTEFDSQVSLVAHGAADAQRATLPTGSGQRVHVDPGAGRMRLTVHNQTTGDVRLEVLNTTLGAVVYEQGGTTLAYEGGGVWKRAADGGVTMVSPPEVHYRSDTLTLPLVTVTGGGDVTGSTAIRQAGPIQSNYPNATLTNPVTSGEVRLSVTSEFYRAWGRFFVTRTGGTVSYDHPNETVTVELVVTGTSPSVGGGIISGASAEEIQFQNQGGVDSYNSSAGDYATTATVNTTIVAVGSVVLQNQAEVYGDIYAGGDVTLYNKALVDGNVTYGGSLSVDSKADITGTISDGASVTAPDAVGYVIDRKLDNYSSTNDNDAEASIDNTTETLQGCGSTCTVENGQYHLSELSLGTGDHLVLDTSGGPVEIAVDGQAQIQGDAVVEVQGSGPVRFYLDDFLQVQNDANVTVPGDRSGQLWFYLRPDASVDVDNKARLVGVLYGPGRGSNSGATIDVDNQAQVYGALVGSVPAVPNGVGIHFDEALVDADPLAPVYGGTPRLTYLHVSRTPVNVTAG